MSSQDHMQAPRPQRPHTLARWATLLTGAFSGLWIVFAVLTPAYLSASFAPAGGRRYNNAAIEAIEALNSLSGVLAVAAYTVLGVWWYQVRTVRRAVGHPLGGLPGIEWWGWFVPLGNWVLPLWGMRALTRKLVSLELLLAWWIPFVIAWASVAAGFSILLGSYDFDSGEFGNPDDLNGVVVTNWLFAVALTVSWGFLAVIIQRTTQRCTDPV